MQPGDDLVTQLKVLTGHRRDLVEDRTRTINACAATRRDPPALERGLDLGNVGPLVLRDGRPYSPIPPVTLAT
jgi:hypothetical protein